MPVEERFGPTRRGGPVFRWLGEPLAIDLANTVMVVREGGEEVDLISTPAELERWLTVEGERLEGGGAAAGLGAVRELRDAVRGLLTAAVEGEEPSRGDIERVNAASAAAPISPRLALAGGRAVPAEPVAAGGAPLPRLLGALARAAIELLADTPEGELRICRAPSCGMFYLGSRRWCCSACGNRGRAARHYRRHKAAAAMRGGPAGG
jgi:predicted RNA-binding Zn ribbon-like protein